MFLRVVHSSIDPAKIDDVLALKDDVIAATKKQAGFVSFHVSAVWPSHSPAFALSIRIEVLTPEYGWNKPAGSISQ